MTLERTFPDGSRIVTTALDDGNTKVWLEEAGGRDVSRTFVIPLLMRVGCAVVRMDGIGGVGTEEDARYRGYSRRVLEAAVEVMRDGNAALTTLYGIPDFYPKYGYATCGPEFSLNLPLEEVPPALDTLPEGWTFGPIAAADLPAIQALYQEQTRRATGAIVREPAHDDLESTVALAGASPEAVQVGGRSWRDLAAVASEPGTDACRVLRDDAGEFAGYAWVGMKGWWIQSRDPGPFHLGEMQARDSAAADALVGAVRAWAREVAPTATHVAVVMPPEGPVAHAAALQNGVFVTRHTRVGEFMARLLDIGRLFEQLQPELSARIAAARTGFTGSLTFLTDEGEGTLGIADDGVTVGATPDGERLVVDLPQHELARLALGGFEPGEVLARLPNPPDERMVSVLEALFPRRHPHIHAMDRF